MSTKKKLLLGAAGTAAAGGANLDIDDCFSCHLYDGTGSTQVIENGIALGNSNDGGSAVFTGSSTNTNTRVNIPTSANFNFGTGDFTIEAFINLKTSKNYHNIYDQRTPTQDATTNSPVLYIDNNNYVIFLVGGAGRVFSSALSLGVWYHVAVTRASGSTKMFLNGTQQGNAYSDSLTYVQPASDFSFGGSLEQNSYNLDGFLSNLRVVKGTALYTSNFTAPTAELTAVSGTSLLTAQGSTPFVDNSGNSVALTLNNSPVASEFGPFTGTDGEGGLVWTKNRDSAFNNFLYDTERGVNKYLISDSNIDQQSVSDTLTSFNSNGFTLGGSDYGNITSGNAAVSWTFRKAPKFFDVVTYTGNGTAGRTVSHNLGSVPGCILIKRTNNSAIDWQVYHRGVDATAPEDYYLALNTTAARVDSDFRWNDTAPTATEFTLGNEVAVNQSGGTFVAYLFAHNDGDGEFGPTGDQDIIKCGSYTGTGSAGNFINLGFEPQWLLVKSATRSGQNWEVFDNMRGMPTGGNSAELFPNTSSAERSAFNIFNFTPTGFETVTTLDETNESGQTFIYIAIRRGPMAVPTDATEVLRWIR